MTERKRVFPTGRDIANAILDVVAQIKDARQFPEVGSTESKIIVEALETVSKDDTGDEAKK